MRRIMIVQVFVVFLASGVGQAAAQQQDFIIYPSKGQSQQQLEQDKYQCYGWAKQQTGFDPMQAQPAAPAPPPSGSAAGGAVRGGAGGALAGAAIGSFSGNAGKGAAIGAAAGGVAGGMRSKRKMDQQQQAYQQSVNQQNAQYAQKRDYYNRAYKACLSGRGYTVD